MSRPEVGVVFGLLDRPLCTGLEEASFPGQGGWQLARRLLVIILQLYVSSYFGILYCGTTSR
jgi:hypothetical protein